MSGAHEQGRRRRPPRTFVISTHLRVQDRLDGTIRLRRGFMCQEPAEGRSRGGDWLWVKVLDSGLVVKVERRFLLDVPSEFSGLLEPVSDPDARLKLLNNPIILQQLVALQADAPLWVQRGQQDELLEAELKYVGPLTRGSSSVFFGVQLKGSAAGKGVSNGSFRGQRLFTCPDACALFLPASDIRLRHWTSRNGSVAQERGRERDHRHPSNGHQSNDSRPSHHHLQQQSRHISFHQPPPSGAPQPLAPVFLPQTAESAPIAAQVQTQVRRSASAPLLHVGQRVCFPLEDTLYGGEVLYYGEVRFCGVLASRSSSGTYVGVLLDAPVGNWDGLHQGEKLCHIPSVLYGLLLPITSVSSVSPETTSQRHTPPQQRPKPILKPAPFPDTKPAATSPPAFAPKLAIMPPSKPAPKPPPLPPPKPALKPLSPLKPLPPPLPLPKLRSPTSPTVTEQLQHTNGVHGPASPLPYPDPPDAVGEDGEALEVGSMVEVNDPPIFGVICWIGRISGIHEPVAGIELDQELSAGTDGSYLGERHFRCPANKGLFVKLRNCRRDSRFPAPETPINQVERCNSIAFAEWGSERVEEDTPPVDGDEARERYQGWKRGIQGHLNSCYLDATLFSLFSVCSSADWILFWPCDIDPTSCQAQDLLRCEVVNPLRRFGYVCASKTMALRRLLEAADRNTGFTSQEKDPEEFLNRLFQLLRVEPLLKIRSMTQQPQECHLYQLFPRMRVAGVQTLLESSFLNAGLKFVEAPSCLLLLMPRFGKDFKMFDAIFPTLSLDITDLLDDTLRQCSICQAVAQWECLQCYTDVDITPGRLKQFCPTCNTQVHSHRKRTSHSPVKVGVPAGPWPSSLHCARQTMSLFAVTSIETSHYVSFIRHGPLPTDWMFFDSMADREGGENGFNVPRVMACPEVGRYLGLSEEELSRVDPASLREPARRLLCDSYMCLYHSPELSLYK